MLPFILLIVWCFILFFFQKLNMHFFKFLAGSIGLFCFSMYFGLNYTEKILEYSVTFLVSYIGKMFKLCIAYPKYSHITVYYCNQAISFLVDYECSGFVETLVYISLLWFYPVFTFFKKIIYTFLGTIYILLANVLRVSFICILIKFAGPRIMFFSHTIFARILFFMLIVILYYYVFTKPHILNLKVGNLQHD
ncbi:exosortase family protein XrtG [Caloranaerobacter sp. DY30410]|uniref:exosortase family protein XrtG n=1 Tax=Caloranaerobacter sp. DY30410 TaxID=3238305 RepID=UPI003D045C2C